MEACFLLPGGVDGVDGGDAAVGSSKVEVRLLLLDDTDGAAGPQPESQTATLHATSSTIFCQSRSSRPPLPAVAIALRHHISPIMTR